MAAGLTHLYVRTGSSRQGFEATAFLEALLPVAHAAGLRVYGWDFPYLEDVAGDIERAMTAITFRTTTGHRIDGFVPDIETGAEGTNLTAEAAGAYSPALRAAVGDDYPLIACVPNPSPRRHGRRSRTPPSSPTTTPWRRWCTGSTASPTPTSPMPSRG